MPRFSRSLVLLAAALLAGHAHAGGFTAGANGSEVLGRGGAFVAKADSPSALEYNVAGLAQQRGTRLLFDSNITLSEVRFTRAGVYPGDPNDPRTPYAGQPYPTATNQGGAFYAPALGITSDFGYFKRWTFGIGAWGPPSVGNRRFGDVTASGLPAPQRYDVAQANLLVIYPTLAAAVRATRWLDIGLALHLVYSNVDFVTVSYIDTGNCPPEYPGCDARAQLRLSGWSATASLGALVRPLPWLAIGLNVWAPTFIKSTGTIQLTPPDGLSGFDAPGEARLSTQLPAIVRLGVRARWLRYGREQGDLELDGQYEAWGAAQGKGPEVYIPSVGFLTNIHTQVLHHYHDTGAVRLGASYNLFLPRDVTLSFRLGLFFDSAATDNAWTRVNFDSTEKLGSTLGLGLSWHGLTLNLAYAYIWSPDRHVDSGEVRPLSVLDDPNAAQRPAINNGDYHTARQIFSLGLLVHWDRLIPRRKR